MKLVKSPLQPSAAEIEEHEATGHVQYRSWCPVCVAARSTGQPHTKAPDEDETAVPRILWDYGFLGKDDGKTMPILVCKDARTKRIASTFVQAKGSDPYAIKFGQSFLETTGYRTIINKSDGEHSIVALKRACAEAAVVAADPVEVPQGEAEARLADQPAPNRVEALPQEAPVGDHQANGEIEAAVREVKRQCRALKYALEAKLGTQLEDGDPVLSWLPRHAADLISRYRRGEDGKTPEQRRTGKQWRKPAIAFGEKILFREAEAQARLSTLQPVMSEGRYIGHHGRKGTLLVITKEGVKHGVSFRRLPPQERWPQAGWSELRGFPWDVRPRARNSPKPALGDDEPRQPILEHAMAPPEGPRRLYVLKNDVEHFGPSPGCPGCDSVIATGSVQPGAGHTQACRERFIELLKQDEAGQRRLEAHRRRLRPGASEPQPADSSAPAPAQPAQPPQEPPQQEDTTMLPAETPAAEASGAPPPEPVTEVPSSNPNGSKGRRRKKARTAEAEAPQPQQPPTPGPSRPQRPATSLVVSLGSQKRAADDSEESSPGASGSGDPQAPVPSPGAAPAEQPMSVDEGSGQNPVSPGAAAAINAATPMPDICSLEPVEAGVLTAWKAELLGHVKEQVRSQFRHCGVDASAGEINHIAELGVEIGAVDIAEIYSPARLTARAAEFGLRPGFAVDLSETKPSGGPWDLVQPEDRAELEKLQEEQDPLVLTGSPPCTPFTQLMAFNLHRMNPERRAKALKEGRLHLETSVAAYRRQMARGRIFLHEHPKGSKSFQEKCMKDLQAEEGVYTVTGPMCNWNLCPLSQADQRDPALGPAFCKKETCWVTNSKRLAERLRGVCSNTTGARPWHRHIHLTQGLGHFARIYTPELVTAILEEAKAEILDMCELSETEMKHSGPSPHFPAMPEGEWSEYWDDVNGGYLPTPLVKAARAKEIDWVHKEHIYDIVPRAQAYERTGKAPIPLKWVDTNKGDHSNPNVRSRLVVKEIKAKAKGTKDELGPQEVFSSMPPLEAFMSLVALFVAFVPKGYKLAFFDISRAHFMGKAQRELYVELESEDKEKYGSDKCGLLQRSMYGTQDASQIWQKDYTELLRSDSFECGVSNGAVFYKASTDTRVMVHGDDFAVCGRQEEIDKFEALLRSRYELKKMGNLGLGPQDDRSATYLNRVVQLLPGSKPYAAEVAVEPDSRHAQLVVRELGLSGAKGTDVPMPKRSADEQWKDWESPLLTGESVTLYRSCTMRIAYLAQDRADLAEASKTLARFMQQPNEGAMQLLRRVARYLIKHPQVRRVFRDTKMPDKIRIFVDSDHAGCAVTRKSTTGYVSRLGHSTVKHGSNLQSTTALSSGESEYYALVKASKEGLGLQSLLGDWGLQLPLEVSSDSSAARGHVSRRGLGKMRHIQTRYLWVQERVGEGHIKITSVPGTKNVADILTKCTSGVLLARHLATAGFEGADPHKSQRGLL